VDKELAREREKLERYLDVAGNIILTINKEEEITWINKRGCEILECKKDEIIGKNWFDTFLPKKIKSEVRGVFSKIMSGEIEAVDLYENEIVTKAGKRKIIAWFNSVLKDEEDNIVETLSSGNDVTPYKNIEEELQVSESKYKNLVDSLSVGVSLISPEMEVLAVNALMEQWFPDLDVSKRPLCYKAFYDPPKDERCSYCPVIKTLEDGLAHEAVSDATAGGSAINYRILSTPVKNGEGKVTAAVRIIENITARIKVEKELFKKLHDLEVFQKAAVDRELKMVEQKKKIRELEDRVVRLESGE